MTVSLFSFSAEDGRKAAIFPLNPAVKNLCGPVGASCAKALLDSFGLGAYFLPIPLLFGIVIYLSGYAVSHFFLRVFGIVLLVSCISTGSALLFMDTEFETVAGPGGYLGSLLQYGLNQHFALIGSYIFLSTLLLSGLLLSCDYSIMRIGLWIFGIAPIGQGLLQKLLDRPKTQNIGELAFEALSIVQPGRKSDKEKSGKEKRVLNFSSFEDRPTIHPFVAKDSHSEPDQEQEYHLVEEEPVAENETKSPSFLDWFKIGASKQTHVSDEFIEEENKKSEKHEYSLPPLELLTPSVPVDYEQYESTVKRQAKLLEKAFFDFGFNVRVVEIQTGPVIAQFEVQLERGLRLNKILGLTDDLAIALKVPSVRIVAPIPGKNTVGVEIPNEERQIVRLREVMEETAQAAKSMYIPIFLGKDVAGCPMVIDLTKLPHLLIAGRTGTGKSVCLNSIIVSILMTRGPEDVRMIMIDPKMVEMSSYKSIPHLMHPVVTDMKKAEAILGWAVEKMEQRYQLLARAGVRQLSEYNKLSEEELYDRVCPESDEEWEMLPKSLPYMVIVADELADLMMTSAKEVETHIIRLAQKSRAVGIHLVLATQKPTVDIITGLIKSNLPARIAFEVASRSDSQVVLDRNGAEKLLGNGDMLFLQPGTSFCLRGQGTYVSDKEINTIIAEISTDEPEYAEELVTLQIDGEEEEGGDIDPRDALYEKAVECVIREGRGSLSLLQRKLSIGYSRAARLIDIMAEDGVVGVYNGSQAREVITTLQEWRRKREAAAQEAAMTAVSPSSSGSTNMSGTSNPNKPSQSSPSRSAKPLVPFSKRGIRVRSHSATATPPVLQQNTPQAYSPIVPTLQVIKKPKPVFDEEEEELDDLDNTYAVQEEEGYDDIPFDVEDEGENQEEYEDESAAETWEYEDEEYEEEEEYEGEEYEEEYDEEYQEEGVYPQAG